MSNPLRYVIDANVPFANFRPEVGEYFSNRTL